MLNAIKNQKQKVQSRLASGKKLITLAAAILICTASFAQNMRDVVYLKNGSIIKGIIKEQTPPVQIKIQTADGSIIVYKYDEIEKMTREEMTAATKPAPDLKQYGGHLGLGIALGGGGIIGVPVRINFTNMVAMEAGIFMRPTTIIKKTNYYNYYDEPTATKSETEFKVPPMFVGGFDFFIGEKYNARSEKIVRNGIMLRGGATLLDGYTENMLAIGWARERFKEKRKHASYIFELGAGVLMYGDNNSPLGEALGEDIPAMPFLFWKFHWNWYVAK